nr:Chain C, TERB1-TBM [Homo sapiens]5WIR_D Chain D, TERB1-TBM [Homo sapiens]
SKKILLTPRRRQRLS